MDKDSLLEIFDRQYALQKRMDHPLGNGDEGIKEAMLALIVESTEVLDEVNWKPWKKTKKEVCRDDLCYELCDCLQFVVNAMLIAGMDHETVMECLEYKWAINNKRIDEGY